MTANWAMLLRQSLDAVSNQSAGGNTSDGAQAGRVNATTLQGLDPKDDVPVSSVEPDAVRSAAATQAQSILSKGAPDDQPLNQDAFKKGLEASGFSTYWLSDVQLEILIAAYGNPGEARVDAGQITQMITDGVLDLGDDDIGRVRFDPGNVKLRDMVSRSILDMGAPGKDQAGREGLREGLEASGFSADFLPDGYLDILIAAYGDPGEARVGVDGIAAMIGDGALELRYGFAWLQVDPGNVRLAEAASRSIVGNGSTDNDHISRDEFRTGLEASGFTVLASDQGLDFLIAAYGDPGEAGVDAARIAAMIGDGALYLGGDVARFEIMPGNAGLADAIGRTVVGHGSTDNDDVGRDAFRAGLEASGFKTGALGDKELDLLIAAYGEPGAGRVRAGDVAAMFENGALRVSGDFIEINPLMRPPFRDGVTTEILQRGTAIFFAKLDAAEDGTPAAALHTLHRSKTIEASDGSEGHGDVDRIDADIRTLTNDPEIRALLTEAQGEAAREIIGLDFAGAGRRIEDRLFDPAMIAFLDRLDPDARRMVIDDALTQLAFFDPEKAAQLNETLMRRMPEPHPAR